MVLLQRTVILIFLGTFFVNGQDNSISFDLTNANKVTLDVYMPSDGLTGSQDNKLWLKLQNGNKENKIK